MEDLNYFGKVLTIFCSGSIALGMVVTIYWIAVSEPVDPHAVQYFKDPNTGLCFAEKVMHGWAQLTNVPCENVSGG